jgi:hypothetical protein
MLHASGAIDQDVSGGIQRNLDTAGIQTDGVAKRNQFVSTLGRHGPGDDRRLEHRALWRPNFPLDKCGAHFGRQDHPRAGMGASPGDGLATHIHHGGLVAVVNMGKHR